MQRITYLLQKLNELSQKGEKNALIDIDLMLDYTRVMYADLMEIRKDRDGAAKPVINEPAPIETEIKPEATTPPAPLHLNTLVQPIHEIKEPIPLQHPTPASFPGTYTPVVQVKKDIRQSIGINDKYLLISELFNNNKSAYEESLDEINRQESYRQALNWIDTNLRNQLNWDDEDETVELFHNILSNFFVSR